MKGEVMEVRYSPDILSYRSLKTDELRKAFLMENLFQEGKIQTVYFESRRSISGRGVAGKKAVEVGSSEEGESGG